MKMQMLKSFIVSLFGSILAVNAVAGTTPPPPPPVYYDTSPVLFDGRLDEWFSMNRYDVHSSEDGVSLYSTEKKRKYFYDGKDREHIQTFYALQIDKRKSKMDIRDIQLKFAYARKRDGEVLQTSKCIKYHEGGIGSAGFSFTNNCRGWKQIEAGYILDLRKDYVSLDAEGDIRVYTMFARETSTHLIMEFSIVRRTDLIFYIDKDYVSRTLPMDDYWHISRVAVTFDDRDAVSEKVMPQCEGNGGCGKDYPHTTVVSVVGNTPLGKLSFSVGMNTEDEGKFTWGFSRLPANLTRWGASIGMTIFEGADNFEKIMESRYSVITAKVPGCAGGNCAAGFVVDQYGQVLGLTAALTKSPNTASMLNASVANRALDDMRGLPEYVNIDGVHMIVDSYQSGNDGGNYGGPGDNHNGNDGESNHSGGVNENSDGCQGCNKPWGGR